MKNRKGLTPIVSTTILVCVTLTIAISTAFWMRSTAYAFVGFEKVECISATPSYDYPKKMWTITIVARNIGTKPVTISQVLANERESGLGILLPDPGNSGTSITDSGITLNQGATAEVKLFIRQGGVNQPFSYSQGGMTVLIKLVSSEGYEYIKICELCPPVAV